MKRYVEKKGKKYILTFDEYGILDTVVLKDKPETLISTKNRDVHFFVNNQEIIALGGPLPKSCNFYNQRR